MAEVATRSLPAAALPDGFDMDITVELVDAEKFIAAVGRRVAQEAEELVEVDEDELAKAALQEVIAEMENDGS